MSSERYDGNGPLSHIDYQGADGLTYGRGHEVETFAYESPLTKAELAELEEYDGDPTLRQVYLNLARQGVQGARELILGAGQTVQTLAHSLTDKTIPRRVRTLATGGSGLILAPILLAAQTNSAHAAEIDPNDRPNPIVYRIDGEDLDYVYDPQQDIEGGDGGPDPDPDTDREDSQADIGPRDNPDQEDPGHEPDQEDDPEPATVEAYSIILPIAINGGEVSFDPTAVTPDPKPSPSATPSPSPSPSPIIVTPTTTPSPIPTITPTETPTPTEAPELTFRLDPKALVYESDDTWEVGKEARRYGDINHETHDFAGVRANEDGTYTAFFINKVTSDDPDDPTDEINVRATEAELLAMGFTVKDIDQETVDPEAMDDLRKFESPKMDFVSDPLNPDQTVWDSGLTQVAASTTTMGDIDMGVDLGELVSYTGSDGEPLDTEVVVEMIRISDASNTKGAVTIHNGPEGLRVGLAVEQYGFTPIWGEDCTLDEIPHSLNIRATNGGESYQIVALDKDGNTLYASRNMTRDPLENDAFERYGATPGYYLRSVSARNGGLEGMQVKAEIAPDGNPNRMPERNVDGDNLRGLGGDTRIIGNIVMHELKEEDRVVLGERILDGISILDQGGNSLRASLYNGYQEFTHAGPHPQTLDVGIDSYRWMGPQYTMETYRAELEDAVRMNSDEDGLVLLANIMPAPGFSYTPDGPLHAAILFRDVAAERDLSVPAVYIQETARMIEEAGGTLALPVQPSLVTGEDEDFLKVLDELKGAGKAMPTFVFDVRNAGDFVGGLTAREFDVNLEAFMSKYNVAQIGFRNAGIQIDEPQEKIDAYWSSLIALQKRLQREGRAQNRLGVLFFDPYAYAPHAQAGIINYRFTEIEGEDDMWQGRGHEPNANYHALKRALAEAGM